MIPPFSGRGIFLPQPKGKMITKEELDDLFALLEKYFGFSKEEIIGRCRKVELMVSRYLAAYFLRHRCKLRLEAIGLIMNRSHSQVILWLRAFDNYCETDDNIYYLREDFMRETLTTFLDATYHADFRALKIAALQCEMPWRKLA